MENNLQRCELLYCTLELYNTVNQPHLNKKKIKKKITVVVPSSVNIPRAF